MSFQLRIKILLISLAILFATLGATVWVSSAIFTREYSSALEARAFVIGRSLKIQLDRLLRLHIPLEDLIGFDEQCREIVEQYPDISFARVVNPSGKVLFRSNTRGHETMVDRGLLLDIRSGKETIGIYEMEGARFYSIVIPVFGEEGRVIAAVNLGFPVSLISTKTRWMVEYTVITAIIFLGIGSILLMISMNLWVSRPLGKLLSVIQDIMKTGTDSIKVVAIDSRDEIGQLGEAFNGMVSELNRSHRKIREYAGDLEATNEKLRLDLEERMRLEAAIEQAGEAVVITDRDGGILYANPAVERITGYERHDVLGRSFRIFFDAEESFHSILKTLSGGEVWSGQTRIRIRDEKEIAADVTVSPVRDAEGKIINYVVVARDVTREVHIEKQLQQAQKMESIGTLAGGIAHDFNNLLTVIIGNTELALLGLDKDSRLRRSLEEINAAAERASGLTRQILAFSRRQIIQPKVMDLNDIIENARKMLGRLIGENVELVIHPERELEKVKVDPGQMEQVIFNLAVNARDAMPGGGRLIIETANVELDEAYGERHAEAVAGSYVRMTVTDTGIGMDAETRSHIFEPFFTTKETGMGTGMGLATVYGIVKQNHGFIDVYSEVGRGATFKMYLPSFEGEGDSFMRGAGASPESLGGSETILVVEDDPMLRELTCRILLEQGYQILEAQNGGEALDHVRRHDGPIHLVLTDVIMPGMSVREMAAQIQSERKEVKILYMSGYTDEIIAHYGVLEEGIALLSKPFTSSAILQKIRQVLDGRTL